MSFSDYKNIAQVQQEFTIRYAERHFLRAQPRDPAPQFREEFQFNLENIDVYTSEASRAEMIIGPILREVYKQYYQHYALWVQKAIRYDDRLTGTPDYLISTRSPLGKTVLAYPLLVVAEAKKNDFEQGWGQCLAELIAAQKLNADEQRPVYGIVTDGKLWEFGKLRADVFVKHTEGYVVDRLAELFGAIHEVFEAATHPQNPGEAIVV